MAPPPKRPHGPPPPQSFGKRTIDVAAGCVATDEEIVQAINHIHKRKLEQNEGFSVDAALDEAFIVRVAAGVLLEQDEIVRILNNANRAKAMRFSELLIIFHEGEAVGCNINMKERWGSRGRGVRVGGPRQPEQF